MRRSRFALLALVALFGAETRSGRPAAPRSEAKQTPTVSKEAKQLQGTWTITAVTRNGAADPAQLGERLIFTGNKVVFKPAVVQFAAFS